jgi:hypothetical protein
VPIREGNPGKSEIGTGDLNAVLIYPSEFQFVPQGGIDLSMKSVLKFFESHDRPFDFQAGTDALVGVCVCRTVRSSQWVIP